jgi:Mrp family chromosome partitioning ATPase
MKKTSSFSRNSQKENPTVEKALPLSITDNSGTPLITFPGEVVDSMRYLINRIESKGKIPARISMVSSLRGEGTTYLSRAFGATLAHDLNVNVCVVELNWWWPSPLLEDSEEFGFADFLQGEAELDEVIFSTGIERFSIVPSGKMAKENRPIIARGSQIKASIAALAEQFDHLILDIPAIMATNDSIPLAGLGDTCCMIVQQGATGIADLHQALDEISHLKIIGVVMNRYDLKTPKRLVKLISAI